MEIEEICLKLKPKFGVLIDKLFFKYRFEADARRKKRIERCILALYQQNVDTLLANKKVLLPVHTENSICY